MATSFFSVVFCSTSYRPRVSAIPRKDSLATPYLLLDVVEGVEVVLEELELSLLRPRVRRSRDDLVLFPHFVELHLQLHHLQSSVLYQ